MIAGMDVLSSRTIIRPSNPARSRQFYRHILGLAVHREFGDPTDPGMVFFLGQGLLEVSGRGEHQPSTSTCLWLQVRDLNAEHDRLNDLGVAISGPPKLEPWGLHEMWISDPDGIAIVLVQVPDDHPLRRDQR